MNQGFAGFAEVGDKRYFVYSQTETEQQVIERIHKQQAAAKKVIEILNSVANEYDVSPSSIYDEMGDIIKDNKKEK